MRLPKLRRRLRLHERNASRRERAAAVSRWFVGQYRAKIKRRRAAAAAPTAPRLAPGAQGADWAWGHPSPAALHKAGVRFACRYLSTDPSKNLTAAEARALAKAGIPVVVVWETTANRALAGSAAGAADARAAAAQARACGMPAGRPVYFAVDFDETPAQAAKVAAYFEGVASVLGRERTGVYGGYWAVRRLLDAGLVTWAWQTYAWSGGQWDPRAQLRQVANGRSLGGIACDLNRAQTADVGQWVPA